MSDSERPPAGSIVWLDLTVDDASGIRDFYEEVVGWSSVEHDMGDYADFAVVPDDSDEAVAGICFARGENVGIPPQWMIYIQVDDLDASMARCVELGGEVIHGPRDLDDMRFCIIRDPAGAVSALIS